MSIASDLHDDLGASLSQIAILSEVARVGRQNGNLDEILARIGSLARETVSSTSDLVWAIRPQRQRLSELSDRVREYADDLLAAAGIELRFMASLGSLDVRLLPEVRQQAFLILKEAVRNAARHSECSVVQVSISVQNGLLLLSVQDDGKGMQPGFPRLQNGVHHGLMGMQWRAKKIGGRLSIESSPGEGVTVRLVAPLQRRRLLKLVGGRGIDVA
jgi:signal transduction histidine kinase